MKTYRRYTTRLRFEVGQEIPRVGARWETETVFARTPVRIHLLRIKKTFPHPDEPGVTLMDAYISRSHLPQASSPSRQRGRSRR